MNIAIKDVLRDKKGVVEALGVTVIVMTLLVAVGMVVANYAILSKQASMLTSLSQEITNRAEAYTSVLNADMMNPQTPSLARECSTTTEMCTQILAVTPSEDGTAMELRIQADAVVTLGQSVVQDVKLVSNDVTHVTAIDEDGRNVWALTDEGLRFRAWDLAEGKPSEVPDDELEGPKTTNKWVMVDDRAGIDSAGSLWVWGKNDIGQAGVGAASTAPVKPERVTAEGVKFRFVVTGDDRGYAIDTTGRAWAWGKNNLGQLGLGHKNPVMKPTLVPNMPNTRFMTLAIGKNNVVGLSMAGELHVAGAAQAGYADVDGAHWRAYDKGTRYTSVAASSENGGVALVREDGVLVVNGSTAVSPSGVKFTSVARGATVGYAIAADGTLYAWGTGTNGELGMGATTKTDVATRVPNAPKMLAVQGSKTGALMLDVTGQVHFTGKLQLSYDGGPTLSATKVTKHGYTTTSFQAIAGDAGGEVFAFLDRSGNLLGSGTGAKPGLWPMSYDGGPQQLVRMPVPEGFSSYTWK